MRFYDGAHISKRFLKKNRLYGFVSDGEGDVVAMRNRAENALTRLGLLTRAVWQHYKIPSQIWPGHVRDLQQHQFTGVVVISWAEWEERLYLFVEGAVIGAYSPLGKGFVSSDPEVRVLGVSEATVNVLSLPPDGVRALKTLVLTEPQFVRRMSTAELEPFCRTQADHEAGVVHIVWEEAEAFVLLPGSGIMRGVLIQGAEVQNGSIGLQAVFRFPEATCQVAFYAEDINAEETMPVSDNFLLCKLAFTTFATDLLFSYIDVVGRQLGNAVILELNRVTQEHEWAIRFSRNGITCTHQFSDETEARYAFQLLLQLLVGYMSIVIGDSLTQKLVDRTLKNMKADLQEIIRSLMVLPVEAR